MLRKATMQDVSRIAEIIVFGKRVAYRPILIMMLFHLMNYK